MGRVEVAVVGGGAAGLIASREAARLGLEVEVFEEHETIGRPESCAGLYSVKGLRMLGLGLREEYLENTVKGAVIHSPGGRSIEIRTHNPVAAVVRREELDRYLAEEAITSGAKINIRSRVSNVQRASGEVRMTVGGGEFVSASVLIDAEGHVGAIARMLYPSYATDGWIPIMQMLVSGHGHECDVVHVWLKPYLRDFFGYLVPIDEKLGRLGVASYKDTSAKAMKFLSEVAPKARIIGYSTSCIYEGLPTEEGLDGNALLVGDVAGQVKSTTGGGVIIGGICAIHAARHAYKLLREGRDGTYRKNTRPIYRELRNIYKAKNWIKSLSDNEIDELFRHISETGFEKEISRIGDMDFQASSIMRGILSLSGVRMALRLIRSGLIRL